VSSSVVLGFVVARVRLRPREGKAEEKKARV
jgi:hypothetical protein